jgi:tetratricopeptide (TPR) repeat protein
MMTTRRVGFLLVLLLGASPLAARGAQDPLARAKDFYAAAAYEDALQVLTELGARKPAADVSAYRVYCLLALGRNDEAKATIEGLVRIDPTFHPSEADASPRVRAFFEQVRRPLLQKKTDELAVMVDSFRPFHVAADVLGVEDKSYPRSWLE